VRDASYVVAAAIVGALLLTWTLGRIVERLHDPLALVSQLVQRVGVSVIFCFVAAQAATQGGFWLILVPVLGLLALFGFGLSAGIVWVWARHGLNDSA
jgi:hypothetical protein